MADAEQIKRDGWRQGSIVGAELARAVEPGSDMSHGKNPRVLHLSDADGRLEFRISDRIAIDRRLLAGHTPTRTLDAVSTRMLALWVAKRYVRQGFPDAFNERTRPAAKKIDRALKRCGADASGIFVALNDWGELEEQDAYRVVISVVFQDAVGLDGAREAKLAQLVEALFAALDACDGIEVVEARHLSESEVTLHDLHRFKRWEFDFRSHSGRPGGPISPRP